MCERWKPNFFKERLHFEIFVSIFESKLYFLIERIQILLLDIGVIFSLTFIQFSFIQSIILLFDLIPFISSILTINL